MRKINLIINACIITISMLFVLNLFATTYVVRETTNSSGRTEYEVREKGKGIGTILLEGIVHSLTNKQ